MTPDPATRRTGLPRGTKSHVGDRTSGRDRRIPSSIPTSILSPEWTVHTIAPQNSPLNCRIQFGCTLS